MIRRIRIDGYKSFRNFSLELRPLSVIFGPNASGKSNLLDALYILSRAVTFKNLRDAFEGHRGDPLESFYYADEGYEKLREKDSVRMSFQVDVELSDATLARVRKIVSEKRRGIETARLDRELLTERFLRYRLELEALPATGHLRVRDERLSAITKVDGREKSSRAPFISREGGRIHLRMERQKGRPFGYEVGLDHTVVSGALYEPHYPHITAFREELASWQSYYLEPKTLMRPDVPLAEVTTIGPRGENLAAFLNVLRHRSASDFENLNLALRSVMPTDARIGVQLSKEGRVGFYLSENGNSYSARLISEGTLRLIGLLTVCHPASPATLIGYEEPENGVHPVRLKIIGDILKNVARHGKQVVVTTHSPIFPKYFENDDLFVCRKEGHQTTIRPFSSYGPLFRGAEILESLDDRILRGDFGG